MVTASVKKLNWPHKFHGTDETQDEKIESFRKTPELNRRSSKSPEVFQGDVEALFAHVSFCIGGIFVVNIPEPLFLENSPNAETKSCDE